MYYSDTEVKVSLNKPTGSTVQSGVVYGLNDNWQKNGQTVNITGVSFNATMLIHIKVGFWWKQKIVLVIQVFIILLWTR
ncbi:MAG: hypothetical protein CXB60_07450 [Spiroplasma poulsonii]|nr:hypothetical protein [Spiroplasma poulsonii]